ncbi:MAG: hypothetical protein FJZ08_03950 [Candidatus Omnitrophica bacterium]|nr:hypothetical protein [Candidatus Omnitrophota bacterium]
MKNLAIILLIAAFLFLQGFGAFAAAAGRCSIKQNVIVPRELVALKESVSAAGLLAVLLISVNAVAQGLAKAVNAPKLLRQ